MMHLFHEIIETPNMNYVHILFFFVYQIYGLIILSVHGIIIETLPIIKKNKKLVRMDN